MTAICRVVATAGLDQLPACPVDSIRSRGQTRVIQSNHVVFDGHRSAAGFGANFQIVGRRRLDVLDEDDGQILNVIRDGGPVSFAVHFEIDAKGADGTSALLPAVEEDADVRRVGAEGGRNGRRNQRGVSFGSGRDGITRAASADGVVTGQINLIPRPAAQILKFQSNRII